MAETIEGGCACGKVRYSCDAEPIYQLICHCRDCQRASGSAFAAVVFVPADALKLAGAEPRFHTVMSDTGHPMRRGFCADCGSPLMILKPDNPKIALLQAASLDNPDLFKPELSIFHAKAAAWTRSDRPIPKQAGGPGTAILQALQHYFGHRRA